MNRTRLRELSNEIDLLVELAAKRNDDHASQTKIKEFLNTYSTEDVILLQSLMYIGRDDYIDRNQFEDEYDYYREIEAYYEKNSVEDLVTSAFRYFDSKMDSKAVIIDQMVSKRDLFKYLTQGLEILRLRRT